MSRLTAYVAKMDRKLLADAEERKAKAFAEPVLTVRDAPSFGCKDLGILDRRGERLFAERLKLEHLIGRIDHKLSIERSPESEVVLLDAADALHAGVKQYDRLLLAQRSLRKLKERTCKRPGRR
jgi:hypothetical protein